MAGSILPIICVKDVEATSKVLCAAFQWRSTHGGADFDELVDENNDRMMWLHQLDAHEHPRFAENHLGHLGRGFALYVFVKDIEAAQARIESCGLRIVEPLAKNPNAGFRELTFVEDNGYHFTVAEPPGWG